MLTTLFGLVCLGMANAQNSVSSSTVAVEFMGASGGMKMFPVSSNDTWFMVQQNKLQEVDSEGNRVNGKGKSFNVAGKNEWSPMIEEGGVSSLTFSVIDDAITFDLTAHFSSTTESITEIVPCSGCVNDTMGLGFTCQDATSGLCGAVLEDGTCPEDTALCTVDATVNAEELKFSILVSGWDFSESSNQLRYSISIKDKNDGDDNSTILDSSSEENSKTFTSAGGSIVLPTTGKIVGGNETQDIEVAIETYTQGSQQIIEFTFPSFSTGETLYYDPDISLNTDGSDDTDDTDDEMSSAPISSTISLLATSMVVFCAYRTA